VIEKAAPGGQAGSSPKIENYLGFPAGISGDDLARRAVSQAKRFGVEILSAQEAVQVRLKDPYRIVRLSDGSEISGHVLIATGLVPCLENAGDKLTGLDLRQPTPIINYRRGGAVVGGANPPPRAPSI
jgi:thioredoxin reductase (NADPH)